MSTFSYAALDGGKPVSGSLEAPSAEAAKAALVAKGLFVTSVKAETGFFQRDFRFTKRLKLADQAWLARQLSVLADAGLGLPAALGLLSRQKKGKAVGALAEQMRTELLAGRSPSAVTASHQDELGPLFASMVAAGEQSGVLPVTLNQLAGLLETRASLRKKTRAALTYPAAVIVVTAALALVILFVIVPIFGKMFAQFGAKLPGPTLLLVNVSHFFLGHWYALPILLAALGGLAWWGHRQEKVAYLVSSWSFKFPIVGHLLSKSALARVASTISTMMGSGTDVLTVLAYAAQATQNRVWSTVLTSVPDLLRSGRSFSDSVAQAAQETPGTDSNFDVLARMGEDGVGAGATPAEHGRRARSQSADVYTGLSTLESSLEPLLIVVVGAVVGTMIVALYLPIFHIITVLGNQTPQGS
jgi:type IV pilus assembly protein PilC